MANSAIHNRMLAATIETFVFIGSSCLFEDVEYFFRKVALSRLFPSCFEIFLPVLFPWPGRVGDESRIGIRELRRSAVRVLDIAYTLDVGVSPVRIVHCRSTRETVRRTHWRNERIGVVEDGFMIEADELATRVHCRLPGFHGLHLVAAFKHRMRERPTLDVCGVSDQRGPIPESNRLPKPLEHFLNVCLLADHRLAKKVIRDTRNGLHHPGSHGELEISRL